MIQVSTTPAASAPHPARPVPAVGGDSKGFAIALTTLLQPEAGDVPLAESEAAPLLARQKAAATGKDLPDETPGDDGDDKAGDIAFAWFAGEHAPGSAPIAVPTLPALPAKGEARTETKELREAVAIPTPAEIDPAVAVDALATPLKAVPIAAGSALPEAAIDPGQLEPRPSPTVSARPIGEIPLPATLVAGATPNAQPAVAAAMAPALRAIAADPATGSTPTEPRAIALDSTTPRVAAATQGPVVAARHGEVPTVQVPADSRPAAPIDLRSLAPAPAQAAPSIAAQLVVAQPEAPAPRRVAPREALSGAAPISLGEAARPVLVAAPAEIQHAALDLRRHEWMGAMLDRIEAIRDSAGTRETSIRLAPDALGSVDISIREEGDRIHVHFAAESAAARAALSEAQPRLAELAEARGLKLGQTSVDAGTAGQSGQRQQAAPARPVPTAPPSARAEPESTDHRIA